jgi:murein DD-endopeptidase MepM/ murein hydrolase activator NlpD
MTQQTSYTVKSGDTLWGISHQSGVDINTLAKLNHLHGKALHTLHIGQVIALPASTAQHDTMLTINIKNITFEPIKNAPLKLTYDSQTKEIQTDSNGTVKDVLINDHALGIKIEFKGIDGQWITIADHKTLPLGHKTLTVTSRQMVIKGTYYAKPGAQRQSKVDLKNEVKRANTNVHIQPQGATPKPVSKPVDVPKPMVKETRIEDGIPAHFVAPIFTEANLLLSPANEKYRKLILASAKRFDLAPHALAALIDAEANKVNGSWDEKSINKETKATGLTQFVRGTWLEMVAEPRSLMNQRIKQEKKLDKVVGKLDESEAYCLYGVKGNETTKLDDGTITTLLQWRFNPEYAIDTAALYGKINLEKLAKRGLNIAALAPEDLAKMMYMAHHEGAGGAVAVIKGTVDPDVAAKNLPKQIGDKAAKALIVRFNNKPAVAYTYWLYYTLIDKKINVAHFMVKSDGLQPKNMADIATALGAATVAKPAAKVLPKALTLPTQAGAAEGWHDPIDSCALRTAGLASVKSATFGMVRNHGTRAHQGIDLKADPGTPIYAVANGKVVGMSNNPTLGHGYGKTLTLAVDIKDLPQHQRNLVLAKKSDAKVAYFFYAHLASMNATKSDMEVGRLFALGEVLGSTGDTGNANGMSSISKGAHLHFEVRLKASPGSGLSNRIDPKPFINHCN